MRDLRRDFNFGTLAVTDVPENPMVLFKAWLNDAIQFEIKDANAFVLSTSVDNQPYSRVLLLRDITKDGFHFYTNYGSMKSKEIAINPKAAINIFWPDMDRQIRCHVEIEKLDSKLSDDYFQTRPRASQIGAWASIQSQELESRKGLELRITEFEKKFEGKEVPRPEFWGGFEAKINYFEFWQGRPSRLHDRIIYESQVNKWKIKSLYP